LEPHFAPAAGGAERLAYVECRTCGFEPAEQLLLPRGHCPKCHSSTWRRSFRPGGLLIDLGPPRPRPRAERAATRRGTHAFSIGGRFSLGPLVEV
jgi:hypothetical protein